MLFTQTPSHTHTHTGVLRKEAFTPEAFRHRRLTQRCFRTSRHLRTDALAQTGVFTRRGFHTQKLLHREAFAQNSFYTKKFSSFQKGKQVFEFVFVCFLVSCRFQQSINGMFVDPISIRSVHHVGMANSAGVSISTAKKTVDV